MLNNLPVLALLAALFLSLPAHASDPDFCAEEGWYGDGICDEDCASPDPDCGSTEAAPSDPSESPVDICAEEGWYGDGICDEGCASPDPDCGEVEVEPGSLDEPGEGVWMLLLEAWGLAW